MEDNKKSVLLLGGTGAMGVYLAPELVEAGYKVYITSRSEHKSNEKDIIYITGNAKEDEFLDEMLAKKFDVIVDFMVYNTEEFAARYERLLKGCEHYMFLSSYRVYGDSKGEPITEESPRLLDSVDDDEYLATDEYGLTKARQENMLKESGYKNWTVVRPAVTYSKERFQLGIMEAHEFLNRALAGKPVIFPREMLDKQATMSWAGDVAKQICRLVLNDRAKCEFFTVSTAEHHTWGEVVEIYKELIGMQVTIVDLSEFMEVIDRKYQIKYDRMLHRIIDNSKVLEVTGMRQEELMPLKEGLRIELSNFSRNPSYRGYNARREFLMDKLTGYVPPVENEQQEEEVAVESITPEQLEANKEACAKYDGAIVTHTGSYNYGSAIQRWALQNFLKNNGYKYKLFNFEFMKKLGRNIGDRSNIDKFIENHLDTEDYDNNKAPYYNSYIVGSDQVWRDFFGDWDKFGKFYLDFLQDHSAKRIAYAASFGFDKWSGTYTDESARTKIASYCKEFDAVSVREKSGVALVKELGNNAIQAIDPTLLMHSTDYSAIVDNSEYKDVKIPKLFYFLLDRTAEKMSFVDRVAEEMNIEKRGIIPSDGSPLAPVEIWLKCFRDAEYVLTDSFHGMVFSIINHAQFLVFPHITRGLARMTELLHLLGLEDRIAYAENCEYDKINNPIDWDEVEKRLDELRARSGNWLLASIEGNVPEIEQVQLEETAGSCGNSSSDITWEFDVDTGKLTFTGFGGFDEKLFAEQKLGYMQYAELIKGVDFKETQDKGGITQIPENAFRNCFYLTSVRIPKNVTSIGANAFFGCNSINSISIPAGVTRIDNKAFGHCFALSKVYLHTKDATIANDAFYGVSNAIKCDCHLGSSVELQMAENGFTPLDISCDLERAQIASMDSEEYTTDKIIPKVVVTIDGKRLKVWEDFAVKYSDNINTGKCVVTVTGRGEYFGQIKSSFEIIAKGKCGEKAFWIYDSKEKKLTITGEGAMDYYSRSADTPWAFFKKDIKVMHVGMKIISIGARAFFDCPSLELVTGMAAVTFIGSHAFRSCVNLTTIEGCKKVANIGEGALFNCQKLTRIGDEEGKIDLPVIVNIKKQGMTKCNSMNNVVLGDKLKTIEEGAFENNFATEKLRIISEELSSVHETAFAGLLKSAVITVPAEKYDQYKEEFFGKIAIEAYMPPAPPEPEPEPVPELESESTDKSSVNPIKRFFAKIFKKNK